MSSTLRAPSFQAGISSSVTGGTATQPIKADVADSAGLTFNVGSSSGQANKHYSATLAVNTASATALDLTSLTNGLSESVAFAQIVALKVTNRSDTSGEDITVGGGSNSIIAELPPLIAGTGSATLLLATPITVDSTHKILTLAAAAGAAVSVTVTVLGN